MNVGDIVRLKKEHYLSEIFNTNCQIHEVQQNFRMRANQRGLKYRYHIKTVTGELKLIWVYEKDIEMISNIRNEKIQQLGI